MTDTISTYVVYATHPSDKQRGVVSLQMIATSRAAAVSRTRGTLVHRDQDVDWLRGHFHIATELEGVHMEEDLWAATDEAVAAFVTMLDEAPALAYIDHQFVPDLSGTLHEGE